MTYVVLGMHKSGTTLVAEILHRSGIPMVEATSSADYYAGNKGKWKRSPEQQAEINRRRRERYAVDAEFREQAKAAARSRTPEQRREQLLRGKYGIEPADYDAILARQGGRCAICGSEPARLLHVDHCHRTGKVRGLLCSPCNTGLGHFKDDPERLNRAVVYLVQSQQ